MVVKLAQNLVCLSPTPATFTHNLYIPKYKIYIILHSHNRQLTIDSEKKRKNTTELLSETPITTRNPQIVPGESREEDRAHNAAAEIRPSSKSKKRTTWKGKSEFSHPWLLKSLKGHPGTVLHVDYSPNGKFMAATCDGE